MGRVLLPSRLTGRGCLVERGEGGKTKRASPPLFLPKGSHFGLEPRGLLGLCDDTPLRDVATGNHFVSRWDDTTVRRKKLAI